MRTPSLSSVSRLCAVSCCYPSLWESCSGRGGRLLGSRRHCLSLVCQQMAERTRTCNSLHSCRRAPLLGTEVWLNKAMPQWALSAFDRNPGEQLIHHACPLSPLSLHVSTDACHVKTYCPPAELWHLCFVQSWIRTTPESLEGIKGRVRFSVPKMCYACKHTYF